MISRSRIGLDDVLLKGILGALLGLQRFGLMLTITVVIAGFRPKKYEKVSIGFSTHMESNII